MTAETIQKAVAQSGCYELASQGKNNEQHPMPQGFICEESGIWYADPDRDTTRIWICSELHVTALTRDSNSDNHGYLLEFKDADGHLHTWAMPAEMLAGDGAEYRKILLRMGIRLGANSSARRLLTEYIQSCTPNQRALCVNQVGWHGQTYVLPDETIGCSQEKVILQIIGVLTQGYEQRGSLEGWKEQVAAYCQGNSRLVLAVSAAFTPVLFEFIHAEGGVLHLQGGSSQGKTTTLYVGASIWGSEKRILRWRTTVNGLEGVAKAHNHSLLCLDELGELAPKEAGSAAYMLANGAGKSRANRNGDHREIARWRLLVLSTGEISLADHMSEAGQLIQAGQEVRVLGIPSDAGKGYKLFDTLHDFTDGASLANHLATSCKEHCGHAARAFIMRIAEDIDGAIKLVQSIRVRFIEDVLPDKADGQVKRAADRFAIIAAAGELATSYGITGWIEGEAIDALKRCFRDWLKERGCVGAKEEYEAIRRLRTLLQRDGQSRFSHWDTSDMNNVHNRAGFRKVHNGRVIYYLYPQVFRSEVCRNANTADIARLAEKHRLLLEHDKDRMTKKVRIPSHGINTNFYVFDSSVLDDLPGEDEGSV